ncbi:MULTISPECIES: helix-turn-helix domain-containing protein [Pseudomonas]|uniref:helix-turn-helix domain-containing protein n=1 Tax=Pseudomonadaceae TaxID=135621 RepID=UPI0010F8FAEE|nr:MULTISPECIES: helix-turn-helix transcriptional regulator [Pseudomonas]MDE3738169.1 helix-turn-helix transcriptional regulator [Pseudomonas resinovorans]
MSVFARRLKEARKAAGLSQERLGILAGIDPMSASARMNQYEKGKHEPNIVVVRQIADALDLPEAFFYASDDGMAVLLQLFHRLSPETRSEVLELAMKLSGQPSSGQ